MALLRKTSEPILSGLNLFFLFSLVLIAIISFFYSLSLGSMEINLQDIVSAIFSEEESISNKIIRELRLPRVMTGFLVGGMLALAGALMQVLLRNPLAEPYVLGISGGASVFALLAMITGLPVIWINLGAFIGAMISILLVFGLAHMGGSWNPMRVLLTGVIIASGWGAVISLLLAISPSAQVQGMLFWLMGDLGFAHYSHYAPGLLLIALFISMAISRNLNLLSYGEQQASALGVSVTTLRYIVYCLASLLTAAAVMQAGGIGFIGLIIPHLVRLLFGSDHRLLLPVSVLLGGSLLVIADGLARTVIAPQQLPVGVVTAMIGVPLFLILLNTTLMKQKS